MLTTRYKSFLNRLLEPPARLLVACGASPASITVAGLGLTALACAWLLASRNLVGFCGLAAVAWLCDALDGALARLSGRATRRGAYLDAMCDRYAEVGVMITVAAVTGYWLVSTVVVAGCLLVSYAKARAAMEVAVSNLEWPDLMERAERDALYLAGLAAGQLVPWRPLGKDLFWWTLAVLAVLVHATVLQRMRRAWRIITDRA